MPPNKGKTPARKTAKKAGSRRAKLPLPDPWVELPRGLWQDSPLLSGAVVQVMVLPPGTRMRASRALELGVDDAREVEGPELEVPGFAAVFMPVGLGVPALPGGPGSSFVGWPAAEN